jgi:hypothetical protein
VKSFQRFQLHIYNLLDFRDEKMECCHQAIYFKFFFWFGFSSGQGLLLMIPNMYKIAGELLPCVESSEPQVMDHDAMAPCVCPVPCVCPASKPWISR